MGYASAKIEPLYPEYVKEEYAEQAPKGAPESACQICIRCSAPGVDGQMKVTLEYTGDAQLASYLINQAQEIIEEEALL